MFDFWLCIFIKFLVINLSCESFTSLIYYFVIFPSHSFVFVRICNDNDFSRDFHHKIRFCRFAECTKQKTTVQFAHSRFFTFAFPPQTLISELSFPNWKPIHPPEVRQNQISHIICEIYTYKAGKNTPFIVNN